MVKHNNGRHGDIFYESSGSVVLTPVECLDGQAGFAADAVGKGVEFPIGQRGDPRLGGCPGDGVELYLLDLPALLTDGLESFDVRKQFRFRGGNIVHFAEQRLQQDRASLGRRGNIVDDRLERDTTAVNLLVKRRCAGIEFGPDFAAARHDPVECLAHGRFLKSRRVGDDHRLDIEGTQLVTHLDDNSHRIGELRRKRRFTVPAEGNVWTQCI